MTADEGSDRRLVTAALAAAARMAGHAPSIHNTQPWHWRVDAPHLDLFADTRRQLTVSDPDRRLLILSCGAALQHARIAMAAEGWRATVERLPDVANPDHLARLTATGRQPMIASAMRSLQTIQVRHTDRRPVTETEVPPATLDLIRHATEAEGTRLHLLRRDDVLRLASAAASAQTAESLDPRWREEMAYWAGSPLATGLGVPDVTIPAEAPQTTVPGRDFGISGTLPISAEHDRTAVYAILYGEDDQASGWLRAGEALSALWLAATEHNVSVLPLSAAIEVIGTRHELRRMLADLGEPYLVVRIGVPDPEHAGPPHTPRLPADQTVEIR